MIKIDEKIWNVVSWAVEVWREHWYVQCFVNGAGDKMAERQ